jgi:adenosylmethionine-8-amino-7-oxononanoate aminotransferase
MDAEFDADELLALDAAHVWHPYGPMPGTRPPLLVESARGTRLRLADGRELIDGMSSWWAAIHGYRHPALDAALAEQAGRMSHVMFGGLTHEPAVRLARTLVEITPDPLEHVFLCDSGSVSVEVAIKMCLQHWRSLGSPGKRKLLTWRGGYHGDTFHAMSVCDPDGGMHSLWRGVLPEQVFVPAPPAGFDAPVDPAYAALLRAEIARHAGELAAVIVEPVVQGAGGMRFHSPGYLRVLREACDAHDVLLVFDEIATGFGRSGELFAADHAGVAPDVMCLGKALTGGYLTMAAALCTPRVADGISRGELPVLAHGPTFMGNPLACAVANASIELLLASDWQTRIAAIEQQMKTELARCQELPMVAEVRVLGGIGVVELHQPVDMQTIQPKFVDAGIWVRPFGKLVYIMPPYIIDEHELRTLTDGIYQVLSEAGTVSAGARAG